MTMHEHPKTKTELLENLEAIANSELTHEPWASYALALAYIVNDICPDERTTKHVFRRSSRVNPGP
jgi:hypothetical protein